MDKKSSILRWSGGLIRTDLRQYLIAQLSVAELTPETILPKLTQAFLEQQSDAWTLRLYEFLHGQTALLRQGRLRDIPLVRLKTGCHVVPMRDRKPQAFLPGPIYFSLARISIMNPWMHWDIPCCPAVSASDNFSVPVLLYALSGRALAYRLAPPRLLARTGAT